MIRARGDIEQVHVVLVYLLIVLGASVMGGRPFGFVLAALAFGAIDYWFQLPYNEIAVAKPLDWLVLIAFLLTAVVTTQLLARARAREAEARARAAEVARLAREVEHAAVLRESARFKDTLLASVSHDFRTPLTTVRALAEELVQPSHVTTRSVSRTDRRQDRRAGRSAHAARRQSARPFTHSRWRRCR